MADSTWVKVDTTTKVPTADDYIREQAMQQRGSGVNWDDRAKISLETDPNEQANMLRSYGYDSVRVAPDGRLIVTDKHKIDRYVDPGTFEFSDLADLTGEAPGLLGEVAGGFLGAPGGVAGVMGGAAFGGAFGDMVRQGLAGMAGSQRPYDPMQTAEAGAWGAAGEGAGQLLGRTVLGPLYKGKLKSQSGPYREGAQNDLQAASNQMAGELGIDLQRMPAGMQTANAEVQALENAATGIPALQPVVEEQRRAFAGEIRQVLDNARSSLWDGADQTLEMRYGPEQMQNFIEKDLANAMTNWSQNAGTLKNKAEQALLEALPQGADTPIDMSPLVRHLDATIERLGKQLPNTESSRLKTLQNLRDDVAGWQTVGDYRSSKSVLGENLFETDKFGRLANGIYGSMLDSFEQTAKAVGAADAVAHYQTLANIHKHQVALEQDPMFRQWWKKRNRADVTPDVDVTKLGNAFQKVMYSNSPEGVRRFRQMIGAEDMANTPATREGKHVWQQFQRMAFDMVMDKATTQAAQAAGTDISGAALDREVKRLGRGVMNEVFGPEATQTLATLAKFMQNEQVKRLATRNTSNTAYTENFLQTFRSWLRPMEKAAQVAADRKMRNKVARTILPSGSPGVPAGKEYYTHGTVPTVQQIADGFAQMGIPPAQFQTMWRAAAQMAQRTQQDNLTSLGQSAMDYLGMGAPADASRVGAQAPIGPQAPTPLGQERMGPDEPRGAIYGQDANTVTPGGVVPNRAVAPADNAPQPQYDPPGGLTVIGTNGQRMSRQELLASGQLPKQRTLMDQVWPGWDDIEVASLPPSEFSALKIQSRPWDSIPNYYHNTMTMLYNTMPATYEVSSMIQKGFDLAARALVNFPSFEKLVGMTEEDATNANGYINMAINLGKGLAHGFINSQNPLRPKELQWRKPSQSYEEVMAQTLVKNITHFMTDPDRITDEGLFNMLDGLSTFGAMATMVPKIGSGFKFAMSPTMYRMGMKKEFADALRLTRRRLEVADKLKASGDQTKYVEHQGAAFKVFGPAYVKQVREMRGKYAPRYHKGNPYVDDEPRRFEDRMAFLRTKIEGRVYREDADVLDMPAFNYDEEGHPMGLVEHIYEATRDMFGPHFTPKQHLGMAKKVENNLGIKLPVSLKRVMANDLLELEAKYVFMQLANYRDYDWYNKLWNAASNDIVNPVHLPLWNAAWALLSPQNKAETNYADAFHIMTMTFKHFDEAKQAGFAPTVESLKRYYHIANFSGRDQVTNAGEITARLAKDFPDLLARVVQPGTTAPHIKGTDTSGLKGIGQVVGTSRGKGKLAKMDQSNDAIGLHEAVLLANMRISKNKAAAVKEAKKSDLLAKSGKRRAGVYGLSLMDEAPLAPLTPIDQGMFSKFKKDISSKKGKLVDQGDEIFGIEAAASAPTIRYDYDPTPNPDFLPKPSVRQTKDGRQVSNWAIKMTSEQMDKMANFVFTGTFFGDYKTTSFWSTNEAKHAGHLFYDTTMDVQMGKAFAGVKDQFTPDQYRWAQWAVSNLARKFGQSGVEGQAVLWGFSKYTEPDAKSAKNILAMLGPKWSHEPGSIEGLQAHSEEAIRLYQQHAPKHAITPAVANPSTAWDMGHNKDNFGFYPQGSLNYSKKAEDVLRGQPRVAMTSSQPGDVQDIEYFDGLVPKVGGLSVGSAEDMMFVDPKVLAKYHDDLWKLTKNSDGNTTKFAEHLAQAAGISTRVLPNVSGSYVGIERDFANTVVGGGDWGAILQGLSMADPAHQKAFVWYHPRVLTADEAMALEKTKAVTDALPGFNAVGPMTGIQISRADTEQWDYDTMKLLHQYVVGGAADAPGTSISANMGFYDSPYNFSQTPDLLGLRFLNVYGDPDDQYIGGLWEKLMRFHDDTGIHLDNVKIFKSRSGYHEHDANVGYAEIWKQALNQLGISGRPDLYAEDVYHNYYKPVAELRTFHGILPTTSANHFSARLTNPNAELKYLQGIFGKKPVQVQGANVAP